MRGGATGGEWCGPEAVILGICVVVLVSARQQSTCPPLLCSVYQLGRPAPNLLHSSEPSAPSPGYTTLCLSANLVCQQLPSQGQAAASEGWLASKGNPVQDIAEKICLLQLIYYWV